MPFAEAVGGGLDQAGELGGFGDDAGLYAAGLRGAWGHEPDAGVVVEVAGAVDEDVDKVAVVFAVPEQDHVAEVLCVFVEELVADAVFDRFGDGCVGVVVPTDFLDDFALIDP